MKNMKIIEKDVVLIEKNRGCQRVNSKMKKVIKMLKIMIKIKNIVILKILNKNVIKILLK